MERGARGWVRRLLVVVRDVRRRRLRRVRRWLERTDTVVHLSILVALPLLIGLVTYLSNVLGGLSFLLYPPLASGAHTLFSNPEGEFASVRRFVGGLTAGAVCGWVAIVVGTALFSPPDPGTVHVAGAALSMAFTAAVTWLLDIEEPAAFSTALLTLFVHSRITHPGLYVASVAVSSTIVAGGFALWRRSFYEQRDRYLYESIKGDDHVLVPMRGAGAEATAMLAARLAAAHRAGKVVLLDIVEEEWLAEAERALLEDHGSAELVGEAGDGDVEVPDHEAVSESVDQLERQAHDVETATGVPCEVLVAVGGQDPGRTALEAADRANCDLVAAPYEGEGRTRLSPFLRTLFRGDTDVLVHRTSGKRQSWNRVLVLTRGASDVAHGMVDFATRLVGRTGFVSVATCIGRGSERDRRRAESMLADLVDPFEGHIETRVAATRLDDFLERNAPEYDLVIVGASQDRSRASRLVSPPTFRRIGDLDVDVAIVDRN